MSKFLDFIAVLMVVLLILGCCVPLGDPAHAAGAEPPRCTTGQVYDNRPMVAKSLMNGKPFTYPFPIGCRTATWQDKAYAGIVGPALQAGEACRGWSTYRGVNYCFQR